MINPSEETTVNITLKLPNNQLIAFENYLKLNYPLISFEHLPNTEKMYLEDKNFKNLVKQKKDLKKLTQKYINENNHKYK